MDGWNTFWLFKYFSKQYFFYVTRKHSIFFLEGIGTLQYITGFPPQWLCQLSLSFKHPTQIYWSDHLINTCPTYTKDRKAYTLTHALTQPCVQGSFVQLVFTSTICHESVWHGQSIYVFLSQKNSKQINYLASFFSHHCCQIATTSRFPQFLYDLIT